MDELLGVEALNKRINTNQSMAANFSATGFAGLERSGGMIYEEFISKLYMPYCLDVYKEMSWNDPTIGAVLFVFEELARRSTWPVQAGGEKKVDIRAKEFIEECKDDMEMSWNSYITEILSKFVYGWSLHETVFKIRRGYSRDPKFNSKYSDGKIGWRSMPGRSQHSWSDWVYNENTKELTGFKQQIPSSGEYITIPMSKCLLFRTRTDRGNPEGRSLLRNAYRPWIFKKNIEELEAIGVERELAGLPVLTTPEGVDIWNPNNPQAVALKATAERIVTNIRQDKNSGLVLPFGWVFDLVSSGGKRQIDTNDILNRYDQRIAITMLADIVMLGADKVGSFALADVKKSLLAVALEAQVQAIADVLNKHAIPRLLELNNFRGLTDYPKFVPSEIETPDINSLADFLAKLQKLGVNLFPDPKLESYLTSSAGLPENSINSKKKGLSAPNYFDQTFSLNMNNNSNDNGNNGSNKNNKDPNKPNTSDDKTVYNQVYSEGGRK
jgi:hypothetical protein